MRSVAHWTPRYVLARTSLFIEQQLHPLDPWLTREAIGLLDQLLRGTDVAIEFGAGRSTPWIAQRVDEESMISAYVHEFDRFADRSLDFVLIDGMYRGHCAIRPMSKVKPGSLMVVDNANWFLPSSTHSPASRAADEPPLDETWQEFADFTRDWRRLLTLNGAISIA